MSALDRAVAAGTLALGVVLVPGIPGPLRALLATAWFLSAPGLAWVRLLPVDGPIERGVVVVAVSLALDVLVTEAFVLTGVGGMALPLVVLVAITAAGLLATRDIPVRPSEVVG